MLITLPPFNNERAQFAVVALYLMVIYHCLYLMIDAFLAFQDQFPSDLVPFLSVAETVIPYLSLLIFVIGAICFIRWFRRAYNNLHLLGAKNLKWKESWAAGAWFVPLLNFVVPYKIMREISDHTQSMFRLSGEKFTIDTFPRILVYWIVYLTGIAADIFYNRIKGHEGFKTYEEVFPLLATRHILGITSLVLLISIVKKINTREKEMMARFQNYTALAYQGIV